MVAQVAAAVFGGPRWASLDDLLLHAALGLDAARVARLLREEEWEEELQVVCCLLFGRVTHSEAAFMFKYQRQHQRIIGRPPVFSRQVKSRVRLETGFCSVYKYHAFLHSISFMRAEISAVMQWCQVAAQETLRLAQALHAAPDSTAAFWEARQHMLDKQASHSSCITGLVS